jgi:hypothetical protein
MIFWVLRKRTKNRLFSNTQLVSIIRLDLLRNEPYLFENLFLLYYSLAKICRMIKKSR